MRVAELSVSHGDVFVDRPGPRKAGSRLPRFTRVSQGDHGFMGTFRASGMPLMTKSGLSTDHSDKHCRCNTRQAPESHLGTSAVSSDICAPIVAMKSVRVNRQQTRT